MDTGGPTVTEVTMVEIPVNYCSNDNKIKEKPLSYITKNDIQFFIVFKI